MNIIERMRADWNRRAREDANFYVAFGRPGQNEDEFAATAAVITPAILQELGRLPAAPAKERRALDIGCGPGRLMLPLSEHFGEIHGIDISDEMLQLARARLRHLPHAYLHLGSGSDLYPLGDNFFDLVYSYVVFQHIPSREVVLNYLREAKRVLKPAGVLCCQLRGQSPPPSELHPEAETWTGCTLTAKDVYDFARERDFPLVGLSGIDTQYMWATFRKGTPPRRWRHPLETQLKAVTNAIGPGTRIPQRGRTAVASLWIDAMPEDGDLSNFEVFFGESSQFGNYLSPITESGGCQMNVRLPDGIQPGLVEVRLGYRGTPFGSPQQIEVILAPPLNPTVADVTDATNLTSRFRSETGGLKIVIDEITNPESVSFHIAGYPTVNVQLESKDPITSRYEFTVPLPPETPLGKQKLAINIAGAAFQTLDVDVV